MPFGSSLVGQEALGNRAGVDDANILAFQKWQELQESCVVKRVMVVRKDRINVSLRKDLAKNFQRISRDSHKTCLALLQDASQRRQRFPNNLIQVAVFIVVRLDEINVVHSQPGEAFIHTPSDALGREIKIRVPVSSDFCSKKIAITRYACEGLPENSLRSRTTVQGRDINHV